MKKTIYAIFGTVNDKRTIIPRLIVGLVFLSEGIQKFIFPEIVGAGRFENIGFEDPVFMAGFVAMFEIACGLCVLAGFLVRIVTIPLIIIMGTAILTTKIPIGLDKGFWAMAHASRTDFTMSLLLVYLIIYGAGEWSADRIIAGKNPHYTP